MKVVPRRRVHIANPACSVTSEYLHKIWLGHLWALLPLCWGTQAEKDQKRTHRHDNDGLWQCFLKTVDAVGHK